MKKAGARTKAVTVLLIAAMLSTAALTGCWDSSQLEDVTIYFGLGLDVSEENPEDITVTVIGPTTQQGAAKKVRTVSSTGKTVADALNNIAARTDRKMTLGHLNVLLIGRELAEKGLNQTQLDALGRDHELRGDVLIAMVDGKTYDVLKVTPEDHPYIAIYLATVIETNAGRSLVPWYTLRDFFQCWSVEGRDPMMPNININNPRDPVISSTAIFNNDNQVVGIMDKDETLVILMLKNNLEKGRLTLPLEKEKGEYLSATLTSKGKSVKSRIGNDGRVYIDMSLKIKGNIVEYTGEQPLAEEPGNKRIAGQKGIEEAEKLISEYLEKHSRELVNRMRNDLKSDPIGFGRYIDAYHHEYFQTIDWNEAFKEAEFTFEVEVEIQKVGVST